ncbi:MULTISPECIES: HU family DNA-binding protein [unclassified Methylobacterium]|uniref:HU family DNA-binding protein n=1 Tax=unclassified Methylobacterium TaxID=2615210 RepID=UPI0011CA92D3|nr:MULTISPECIES: HU family DNA-binding protein [unclassified Methylobacterium]TXM97109.1 integration host factor subunit beta [Methylobacterium sp. WL64]TXN53571.1 integration host factor subunit beta [Methylobacterium sp. WL2]
MIRSELIACVAEQNPHLYEKKIEAVVLTILRAMPDALARGNHVELRGFGMFEVRERDARTGRNPRTGQTVAIEARSAIYFKPGKGMQARLD